MPTDIQFAALANASYRDTRNEQLNLPIIPPGWTQLDRTMFGLPPGPSPSGFSAEVFQKGNEIVIAYQGTNGDPFTKDFVLDAISDVKLGIGWAEKQMKEAALLYVRVKTLNPTADISFTGHSLGGGLAGLMSVFFNRNAVVFDTAPFQLAANWSNASQLKTFLAAQSPAYADISLDIIAASSSEFSSLFAAREKNVVGHYLQNEILDVVGRFEFSTIGFGKSGQWPMEKVVVGESQLGRVGLHSQQLLLASMESVSLREASIALPSLFKLIGDTDYYARALQGNQKDFLQRLLENQFGAPGVTANGMLNRFGNDAKRIAKTGLLGTTGIRDGVIVGTIEFYNGAQGTDTAPFVEEISGGLRLDMSRIAMPVTGTLLGREDLVRDLKFKYSELLWKPVKLTEKTEWILQGGSALTATASGTGGAVMVGWTDADSLSGGTGADVLIGDEGGDTLAGGKGNDLLIGGLGADSYLYSDGDGIDVVRDKDRLGHVKFNGTQVTGTDGATDYQMYANAAGRTEWRVGDMRYLYIPGSGSVGAMAAVLEISRNGGAATDKLVIENFNLKQAQHAQSYLGIKLEANKKLAVQTGGGANPFKNANFTPTGIATGLIEGGAKYITVALNTAAQAQDKISIFLGDLADKFKALLGDDTVAFVNGKVELTLTAGQTEATFALIEDGNLSTDAAVNLTATLIEASPAPGAQPVVSNTLTLNLDAAAETGVPSTITNFNVVIGTNGDDTSSTLRGTAGSDDIQGLAGDDIINADEGFDAAGNPLGAQDRLDGGAGRDLIYAGRNSDTIIGGSEGDVLLGVEGDDAIYSEGVVGLDAAITAGNLTPATASTVKEFLGGGAGADQLIGGIGNDVLSGGSGSDTIVAGAGDDLIVGDTELVAQNLDWSVGPGGYTNIFSGLSIANQGADVIYAGAGSDQIAGEGGDDFIDAGSGADYADGDEGDDVILGGSGNDQLAGDVLQGDSAHSHVTFAMHGQDFLDGGEGDDTLVGGGNSDVLYGGAGDDYMVGDDTPGYLPVAFGGEDYLDGEDGNDNLIGGAKADTLYGGAGDDYLDGDDPGLALADQADDYLDGEDGNDTLVGRGGADTLYGGNGNDIIQAGEGDDYADGEAGVDQIDAGAGNDTAFGGAGNDIIVLGAGDDTANGEEDDDQIFGGDGNDSAAGGTGNDVLVMGAGDDTADGEDGADQLFGEDGNDRLSGGAGDDQLVAGAGNDALEGGDGADQLFGQDGDDTLAGDAGADVLVAGAGADTLDGGADNDLLFGEAGDDTLAGGDGNDQLSGGAGADALAGGAGDDLYVYNLGDGEDTITDEAGSADVLILQGVTSNSFTLESPDGSGIDLRFSASDVVHLDGTGSGIDYVQFDDVVLSMQQLQGRGFVNSGSAGADFINGTPYADTITTGAGDDVVFADAGNDVLSLGDGNDLADGGDGNDNISAGTGDDTAFGGNGADVLSGGDGSDALYGEAGSDNLSGGNGDDTLSGGADNDVLGGQDGNDTLAGDAGFDQLAGGNGNDVYLFARGDGFDTVFENDLTAGNTDTLRFAADIASTQVRLFRSGDNLSVNLDDNSGGVTIQNYFTGGGATSSSGASLVERIEFGDGAVWSYANVLAQLLNGTEGNDTITGTAAADTIDGRGGNDTIFGRAGDDTLSGSAGFDTLYGEAGNDTLDGGADGDALYGGDGNDTERGGAGADFLYGNAGNDTLDGGTGNDTLYGGGGSDTYVVAAGDTGATDIIDESVDSVSATAGDIDTLRLTGIAAGVVTVSRSVYDLTVTLNGNQNVRVVNHFAPGAPQRAIEQVVFDDASVLSAVAIQQRLQTGSSGSDTLYGSETADTLNGLGGNDVVYGLGGDDTLTGGSGADWLFGGTGNDTYQFNLGDAADTILDADGTFGGGGIDTLQFGAGITAAAVTVAKAGVSDLHLTINATDSVLLADYFGAQSFERISFADGTVWTQDSIAQRFPINGTAGADTLTGTGAGDYINGLAGNDTIHGGAGNDVIDAGLGSDNVYGDDGDDTLIGGAGEASKARATVSNNLYGGNGSDVLISGGNDHEFAYGNAGNDIYRGGAGADWQEDNGYGSNDLFIGGGGVEDIWMGGGTDVLIGGLGGDRFDGDRDQTGIRGRQLILYNKGDGDDNYQRMGSGGVLSIGGGALYSNLKLVANGNSLSVQVGSQSLFFGGWYGDSFTPANKSVATLQIVIDGTRKYAAASTDPLYNKKVQTFDFLGLVAAYDTAQAAGQRFTVADHLAQFRTGGSDTAAYGGVLAYQYATTGSVDSLSNDRMRAILADPGLGTSMLPVTAGALLAANALVADSAALSTDATVTSTTSTVTPAAGSPATVVDDGGAGVGTFTTANPVAAAPADLPAAAGLTPAAGFAAALLPALDLSAWIQSAQSPWPGAEFAAGDHAGITRRWNAVYAAMHSLEATDSANPANRWAAPPAWSTPVLPALFGAPGSVPGGVGPVGLTDTGAFSARRFEGLQEGLVKLG